MTIVWSLRQAITSGMIRRSRDCAAIITSAYLHPAAVVSFCFRLCRQEMQAEMENTYAFDNIDPRPRTILHLSS